MAQGPGTRRRGPLIWVVIAIAVISLAYFLYGGFGGPDPAPQEEEQGIEMREDIDNVVIDGEVQPPAAERQQRVGQP